MTHLSAGPVSSSMRLLLLIPLLCCLLACSGETDALRVGSNRWPGYAPIYLADDIGWLATQRIQLLEYPHTTGVLRAFDNGLLDAALLTLDEALQLAAGGHDLEILLVADISAGADALYARPPIERLQDLAGQRIGVENTAFGGYFLARILDLADLDEHAIRVVSLPVHEHAEALQHGRIDAAINFSSAESALQAAGARRLLDSRALPETIIDVLVVERSRVSPAQRRQLRALWFESLRQWRATPDEADARLSRRLGLTPASLRQALDGLRIGDAELDRRMLAHGSLRQHLDDLAAYLQVRGLLAAPLDSSRLLPLACKDSRC